MASDLKKSANGLKKRTVMKPPANLRTKEDWIRMYPYLFPTAVLYDKHGNVVRLKK